MNQRSRKSAVTMITCPYCGAEVSTTAVESEDGCCPECGALITALAMTTMDEDEEEADGLLDERDPALDEEEL